MTPSVTESTVKAAIAAIASESATTQEKIEMLIELAHGLQNKPLTAEDLWSAIQLYKRAKEMSGGDYPLLKARAKAGIAGVLKTIPDVGCELLLEAKAGYLEAIPILQQLASKQEVAEAQMNLGLVLQSLVPFNLATIADSINAYQEALRVFTSQDYPQEYAILHNNIAIAYLSISTDVEQKRLYEGLAIQTFESALRHINLIEHPREYAMLQNNLGNALQYLETSHPQENILRAIAAYNQALKVRNAQDTPLEYANTIANKANALFNLPDDLQQPEAGNHQNLLQALTYYQQALKIFNAHQQLEQAELVAEAIQELEAEISI